jgi:DNA-binding NarL/FixJ family response regulator
MPISVVVASRNPLASELMCAALKQQRKHFDVVGAAFSSKELLKQVAEHHPQVTLVSVALQDGPTAGLKALRKLRSSNSGTRPVVLLDSPDLEKVVTAFSAGARGVVYVTSSLRVLCKCLRSVHAGQIWADSTQLQWICATLGEREPARIVSAKGIPLLTEREAQIVRMVAEGLPNLEISSKLGMSPHTVKNHLFRIYEKLGISNRVELVLYALSSRDGSRESSITTQGDV